MSESLGCEPIVWNDVSGRRRRRESAAPCVGDTIELSGPHGEELSGKVLAATADKLLVDAHLYPIGQSLKMHATLDGDGDWLVALSEAQIAAANAALTPLC